MQDDKLLAIPAELRALPQWVCWRYEGRGGIKPTKVPYDPLTGQLASVDSIHTWRTFEQARDVFRNTTHYNGVGFVITDDDPYVFIDLDDPKGDPQVVEIQKRIFKEFDSYSERSPSGKGLHIICKGAVADGRRRGAVEMYSRMRYMSMTGDVFHDRPIADRDQLVHALWLELGGGSSEYKEHPGQPQKYPDEKIFEIASNAANADKFTALWNGKWHGMYPSQSEADFALVDILSFYTMNREQVTRMFRASSLGKRKKAQRDKYVGYMINKAFNRQPPLVELVGMKEAYEKALKAKVAIPEPPVPVAEPPLANLPPIPKNTNFTLPPGLMGDIAKFLYEASPSPVQEIALAGAIGLMAGICGKSYNIPASGLNMYVLMLASTGTGKEAIARGIDRLLMPILKSVPAASQFRGPAEMASGQALVKYLSKGSSCFVSIVGEFGMTMQRLASPRKNAGDLALLKTLLDLFTKSGHGQTLQQTIYADKDNNTNVVKSPSVTILGESTPSTIYEALDEDMITNGLLPRFVVLEYTGPQPPLNRGHAKVHPPEHVVQRLEQLIVNCMQLQQKDVVLQVEADTHAEEYLYEIFEQARQASNATKSEAFKGLWGRVHLKTYRLAALLAVGCNPLHPVISRQHVEWAYKLVLQNVQTMITRFETGRVGSVVSEITQTEEVSAAIRRYLQDTSGDLRAYGAELRMQQDKIVTYTYLHRMLAGRACFRKDRIGATNAMRRTLQVLIDGGDIQEVGSNFVRETYGKTGKAYAVVNFARFV